MDWDEIDKLILNYLPKMTYVEFYNKFKPGIVPRTIGLRAKELGVKPAKYFPTPEHKSKTSNGLKRQFDSKIIDCIKSDLNKRARVDISKDLGISLYYVNRIAKDIGLYIDNEFSKKISAERSTQHVDLATAASAKKWKNVDYASKMKLIMSERSKKLWSSELYRCKVAGGIKKAYGETDLRDRLSVIGKDRYINNPAVREVLRSDRLFKSSKLNDLIALKLESLGFKFEREFEIANYKFDFKIGDILLEINGNYWHSLPDNKKNDLAKSTIINTYYPEYKLRVMWESEIKSIRCNERLLELLGTKDIEPTHIELEDLKFIDNPDNIDKFLSSFHYLGTTNRKKYQFGLLFYNNLVAIATFGQPIRPNIAPGKIIELTRLCRHPRFYNENMMSYFLSKCENYLKGLNLYDYMVTFADLRLHTGSVYKASNWQDMGDTEPDYNYMSNDNIPMHKKTLYNRAVRAGIIERQYAEENGYKKVKIGSKRKFIKHL